MTIDMILSTYMHEVHLVSSRVKYPVFIETKASTVISTSSVADDEVDKMTKRAYNELYISHNKALDTNQ